MAAMLDFFVYLSRSAGEFCWLYFLTTLCHPLIQQLQLVNFYFYFPPFLFAASVSEVLAGHACLILLLALRVAVDSWPLYFT